MKQSTLKSYPWYQANTIQERLAALRKKSGRVPTRKTDSAQTEERWQTWSSGHPFANNSIFNKHLAAEGLTREEFMQLLAEPEKATIRAQKSESPPWLVELHQSFTNSPSSEPSHFPVPDSLQNNKAIGFLTAITPVINQGRQRLAEGVRKLAQDQAEIPVASENIEDVLFSILPEQLLQIVSKTLALELQVTDLQGHLDGATAEEKFDSFLQSLSEPEKAWSILHEYPCWPGKPSSASKTGFLTALNFYNTFAQTGRISNRHSL